MSSPRTRRVLQDLRTKDDNNVCDIQGLWVGFQSVMKVEYHNVLLLNCTCVLCCFMLKLSSALSKTSVIQDWCMQTIAL